MLNHNLHISEHKLYFLKQTRSKYLEIAVKGR